MTHNPDHVPPLAQLSKMSSEMLSCRDLGHSWEHAPLTPTIQRRGKVIEAERELQCQRECGCVRTDVFARDEDDYLIKIKSPISYPPGYILEREDPDTPVGKFTRDVVRTTIMKRLVPNLHW